MNTTTVTSSGAFFSCSLLIIYLLLRLCSLKLVTCSWLRYDFGWLSWSPNPTFTFESCFYDCLQGAPILSVKIVERGERAMRAALNFQNNLEFVGTQNTYDLIVDFQSTKLAQTLTTSVWMESNHCTASGYYYDIVIMTGSLWLPMTSLLIPVSC